MLVVKAAVWLVALGSGTSGGVLAPLFILGGALGALVGHFLPGPDGFWALMGMAGIMSGAMRAPLTGAIFVAELTGHFEALPAAIAASAGAYAISVLIMRRSILTETGIGRIPLVEPGTLAVVGILSRHDLLKARSAGKRAEQARHRGPAKVGFAG